MRVLLIILLIVFITSKISPLVKKQMEDFKTGSLKSLDIMIMLKQADFTKMRLNDKAIEDLDYDTKGKFVFNHLVKISQKTQKDLLQFIKSKGYQPIGYYVQNCIIVNGVSPQFINELSLRKDTVEILSNSVFTVELEKPSTQDNSTLLQQPNIEWNINYVKAPAAWAKGFKGKGFTVANADTGVEHTHPALVNHYRGKLENGQFDHNYNWYDGVRTRIRGNRCGIALRAPCDDNGHGTHTTGTAVGSTDSRVIGVAPEAKWIGCRNMDAGDGRPQTYIECLEFFLAPFDLDRKNPKPELRPAAIGNSYGCPRSEQCEPNSLKQASDNLRTAGVFMAVSAGNSGSSCSSVSDPPAIYQSVISVGASDRSGNIAFYSSRGPVRVDGSNRQKPEITAPGSGVTSCVPGGRYSSFSGTSMASPHLNGAVAILWQAKSELRGNIDKTQKLFEETADRKDSTACGGGFPNNVYGYGILNLEKAVNKALEMK